MKRRIKFIPVLIFTLILSIGNYKCCEELLLLSDLVVDLFDIPNQITVGQTFNAIADVFNKDSEKDCELVDFASATSSVVEVFLQDGTNWNMVGTETYPQSSLEPAEYINFTEAVALNQAGNYRFDFYTDFPDTVEERNEANNSATDNAGGRPADFRTQLKATNNYASKTITVLPLADGTTKIEGKSIVEFK